MSIQVAFQNALSVDGVQVRRYTALSPSWTLDSVGIPVTPYIPFNATPKFAWVVQGVQGNGPLTFHIQIAWWGDGTIVPVTEVDFTGLTTPSFAVPYYKRLQHLVSQEAGGEYDVLITASQASSSDIQFGGRFKVNFKPTPPVNLQVL